ncbi:MAG: hypothetical protein LBL66_04215 [Clostridiales bacterium]|jgi:hypothetical protein|nr:hypothetical protein [Clostridiales bacterium]
MVKIGRKTFIGLIAAALVLVNAACAVFLGLAVAAKQDGGGAAQAEIQLDTPAGLSYAGGTLTWGAVANAGGYVVRVNGAERAVPDNGYAFSDAEFGTFKVYVKAKGDGARYADSPWCAAYTVEKPAAPTALGAPESPAFGGGVLVWGAVPGADGYVVEIGPADGEKVEYGAGAAYYLIAAAGSGVLQARVKAVGDGIAFTDSDWCAPIQFDAGDGAAGTEKKILGAPRYFRYDAAAQALKWESVPFASNYTLIVGGGEAVTLHKSATRYDASAYGAAFAASLVAGGDGEVYLDSDAARVTVAPVTVAEISTEAQLRAIAPSGSYKLTADIALTAEWTPIDFFGTFDGGGRTISGISIRSDAENVGFFNAVIDGAVKDLTLTGVTIAAERANGSGYLGGLAGRAENFTFTNCSVTAVINAANYNVGGFVGLIANTSDGEVSARIDKCFADAQIAATGGGYAAGFAALVTTNAAVVTRSGAVGSVTGAALCVGGFIGYLGYSAVENCYARVNLSTGARYASAGGFIAEAEGRNATVKASYCAGDAALSGADAVGGGFAGIAPTGSYGGNIFADCYYDGTVYTLNGGKIGNPNANAGGITASADLKSGSLPAGFSAAVWDAAAGAYPTLK